ncbi:glycosyltransferase [Calothrix sp. 336/3]|uniref:glycosyltransferase n=1 Tax=Calothrix sp. 336/3 TaxID=1337936 RepID=UPI0004E33874|nr:glycosyltransferase [Calothrix sp. 336/3]AKG23272.1 glycosyl transferase family 1 [Calothrix sp. 336/3]
MRFKFIQNTQEIIKSFQERTQDRQKRRRFISLQPGTSPIGNVLISYILEPFLLKSLPHNHTQYWECQQIAQTFLNMGYAVDIIRYDNDAFIPEKDYKFFIETRWNLQRCHPYLSSDCIKIFHADTAHILFHNAAEANRLLALQKRRGVTLKSQRYEPPNHALENADYVTVLGNEFTINTFTYANKPIYRIPISSQFTYPWNESKDFDACRRNFLWIGSKGLVHKGLDLLLEAFSQMPEYHLTICGAINQETDFAAAYNQELYHTPNIHTFGWVDIGSQEFINLTNNCLGVVYPSCSEGGGGCVINCMHAGLIPLVSYEASVDIADRYGVIFPESSVTEIKNTVQRIAKLPTSVLKNMSRSAWEFARQNHTQEKFATTYHQTIQSILANHPNQQRLVSHTTVHYA